MKTPILVTGATGLVGSGIVHALSQRGDRVRALVRDPDRARRILPAEAELIRGDVERPETLEPALDGVRLVFHAAGMPEQWQRDDAIFDRVNRGGTANVLAAALRAGAERVVYTSTMDVFAAPPGGTLVETNVDVHPKPTAYERSKQAAEKEAEKVERLGLDVVYTNPGAVYGPSPVLGSLNLLFARVLAGKVPMAPPGGLPLAFLDGVIRAHLVAAERGRRGERYLLADEHIATADLVREIILAEGRGRSVPPRAPVWLMRVIAPVSSGFGRLFGVPPLIATGELSFLLWDVSVDAGKAARELGFVPTPAREGIRKTVEYLRERGQGQVNVPHPTKAPPTP